MSLQYILMVQRHNENKLKRCGNEFAEVEADKKPTFVYLLGRSWFSQ